MAKKFRRRKRRGSRKASVALVKNIVKKEVNKTRETYRMVSYVSWSRFGDIMSTTNTASTGQEVCVFSITGGLNPLQSLSQEPTINNPASPAQDEMQRLFTLLPAVEEAGSNLSGVGQYGDGGTANIMDGTGNTSVRTLSNVHVLEGKEAYIKKFYANLAFSNATESTTDLSPNFIRVLVIETKRPLATTQLSQQILLQNHAVPSRSTSVAGNYPVSALGYLNREVIKKVYVDKLFKLNASMNASGAMRSMKLKVSINKKMRWKYYYPNRDPNQPNATLQFQGPYIYLVAWTSQPGAYANAYADIPVNRQPAFALNSILTYMDD